MTYTLVYTHIDKYYIQYKVVMRVSIYKLKNTTRIRSRISRSKYKFTSPIHCQVYIHFLCTAAVTQTTHPPAFSISNNINIVGGGEMPVAIQQPRICVVYGAGRTNHQPTPHLIYITFENAMRCVSCAAA